MLVSRIRHFTDPKQLALRHLCHVSAVECLSVEYELIVSCSGQVVAAQTLSD